MTQRVLTQMKMKNMEQASMAYMQVVTQMMTKKSQMILMKLMMALCIAQVSSLRRSKMTNMMLLKLQPQPQSRSAKLSNRHHSLEVILLTRLSCISCVVDAIMCATADSALGVRTSRMSVSGCCLSVVDDHVLSLIHI